MTWMEFDHVGLARNAGKNLWQQQSRGRYVLCLWILTSNYVCMYVCMYTCIRICQVLYIFLALAVRCNAIRVSRPVLTFLSNILPSSTRTKYEDIRLLRNVGTAVPIYVMSTQEDRFVNADRIGRLKCHSILLMWSPCYSSQRVSSGKKHWFEPFSKYCVLMLPATWNWYSYNVVIS